MNSFSLSNVIQFICSGLMIFFLIVDMLTNNAYLTLWYLALSGWFYSTIVWYGIWQGCKVGDYSLSWRV